MRLRLSLDIEDYEKDRAEKLLMRLQEADKSGKEEVYRFLPSTFVAYLVRMIISYHPCSQIFCRYTVGVIPVIL